MKENSVFLFHVFAQSVMIVLYLYSIYDASSIWWSLIWNATAHLYTAYVYEKIVHKDKTASTWYSSIPMVSDSETSQMFWARVGLWVNYIITGFARAYISRSTLGYSLFQLMVTLAFPYYFITNDFMSITSLLASCGMITYVCMREGAPEAYSKYYVAGVIVFIEIVSFYIVTLVMFYMRKAMVKLQEHNVELEQDSAHKSAFLRTIGHEVRTPLNAIIGCVQLLLKGDTDKYSTEQLSLMNTILQSGTDLCDTMNNILCHIQRVTKEEKLETAEFSLMPLLYEVEQFTLTRAKNNESQVTFEVLPEPNAQLFCTGDRRKIHHILLQLLSNACKFTQGGNIKLMVTTEPDQVTFKVEDTGIGIAPYFFPKVFEPFSQQDNCANRKYGGVGIGLATVKKYVDLMKGKVSFTSKQGEGTTFTVVLPLPVTKVVDLEEPCSPKAAVHNVLVVDDNNINLKVFSKMLQKLNVQHTCVISGKKAIEELAKQQFDLVLLDIEMPEMNGLETIKHMREVMKLKITVYFVTGYDIETIPPEYMTMVSGFLPKPLKMENLTDIVYDRKQEVNWYAQTS